MSVCMRVFHWKRCTGADKTVVKCFDNKETKRHNLKHTHTQIYTLIHMWTTLSKNYHLEEINQFDVRVCCVCVCVASFSISGFQQYLVYILCVLEIFQLKPKSERI